jgi:hypothetical protein
MKTQQHFPGIIAHFDIEQGSEKWHEIRWGKVGGVLAKSLLGKPETLINEIGSCQLEPFSMDDDGYVNAAMQRGIDLEPVGRAEMEKYISASLGRDIKLLHCGWLQNTTIPVLGISPDGVSADLTIQIELKCPGKNKHAATLYGGVIPDDNIDQCLHAFTVNPLLEKLYFGSFRPQSEYPLFPKLMTRETIVDMGTKAKPVCKPVSEWVQILQAAAITLQENVSIYNENLRRI